MADRTMGALADSEEILTLHFEADELARYVREALDEGTRLVFSIVGAHVLGRILERVGAPVKDLSAPTVSA
jgi:hypothetical protein